jgi:hypothetical protein
MGVENNASRLVWLGNWIVSRTPIAANEGQQN